MTKRPERPASVDEYLALSEEEKLLWFEIDKAEVKLLDIQEKKKAVLK